jgi:hypothetical protein
VVKIVKFKNYLVETEDTDNLNIKSFEIDFKNKKKWLKKIKESIKCFIDDEVVFYDKKIYESFDLIDYLNNFIKNKIISRNFPDIKYYGLRFFIFKVKDSFYILIWSGHILHYEMIEKLSDSNYGIFDVYENKIEIPRLDYNNIMLNMEKSSDDDEPLDTWVFPGSYSFNEVFCDLDYFKDIYELYNFKELFKLEYIPQHSNYSDNLDETSIF